MGISSAADSGAAPDDNAAPPRPVLKANTARTRQKAGKRAAAKGVPPAGLCHIVGRLNVGHGKYTVEVHGLHYPVELTLSDDPSIKLDLSDYYLPPRAIRSRFKD